MLCPALHLNYSYREEASDAFCQMEGSRATQVSIVTSVRSGFDAFAQLQKLKLGAEGATPQYSRRSASEQSYSRLDVPLGDDRDIGVEILWNLVNVVLELIESSNVQHNTAAARAFTAWYQCHFVVVADLETNRSEILTQLVQMPMDSVVECWPTVMQVILRAFLSGCFAASAGLIEAAMAVLRHHNGAAFRPEEESCITDIVRLLAVGFHSQGDFLQWQAAASQLVTDARYVLNPQASSDAPGPATQLRHLALDVLVMMSGDIPLILESCNYLEIHAIGFAAALCAIINPFVALPELRRIFASALAQCRTTGPWFTEPVEAILAAERTADLVDAMEVVSEAGTKTGDVVRKFCVAYMAAHVADLCLPALLPSPAEIQLLVTRNRLLLGYVAQFQKSSILWNVALMYLASSPLLNPDCLRQLVCDSIAPLCARDSKLFRRFESMYREYVDSKGVYQNVFRSALRAVADSSDVLERWFNAWDEVARFSKFEVTEAVVEQKWASERHAEAVWEALESQQVGTVQSRLKDALREADVLSSQVVCRIGDGVQNGFIALHACPNGSSFSTMLRVAAAVVDVAKSNSQESKTASSQSSSAVYVSSASLEQRLSSTEYLLHHGFDWLHTKAVTALLREALVLLRERYQEPQHCAVDHLVLYNLVVNKLAIRCADASASKTADEATVRDVAELRLVILDRLASGF